MSTKIKFKKFSTDSFDALAVFGAKSGENALRELFTTLLESDAQPLWDIISALSDSGRCFNDGTSMIKVAYKVLRKISSNRGPAGDSARMQLLAFTNYWYKVMTAIEILPPAEFLGALKIIDNMLLEANLRPKLANAISARLQKLLPDFRRGKFLNELAECLVHNFERRNKTTAMLILRAIKDLRDPLICSTFVKGLTHGFGYGHDYDEKVWEGDELIQFLNIPAVKEELVSIILAEGEDWECREKAADLLSACILDPKIQSLLLDLARKPESGVQISAIHSLRGAVVLPQVYHLLCELRDLPEVDSLDRHIAEAAKEVLNNALVPPS